MSQTSNKVFIVNGYLDKADGNFLREFFITPIGNSNIFIGSYPSTESDVFKLIHAGVEGVLNFMEDAEMEEREMDK